MAGFAMCVAFVCEDINKRNHKQPIYSQTKQHALWITDRRSSNILVNWTITVFLLVHTYSMHTFRTGFTHALIKEAPGLFPALCLFAPGMSAVTNAP